MSSNSLSIILPTLNEKENLEVLIPEIIEVLSRLDELETYELIVVDDGSNDGTEELISDIRIKNPNVNFIKRNEEKSLPLSIYQGVIESNSNNVMWLDADGSMNALAIERLLNVFFSKENLNLAIVGSRFSEGGGYKGVRDVKNQSFFSAINNVRNSKDSVIGMILSILINRLLSFLFRTQLTDLTSGFIVLNKKHIEKSVFENRTYGEYFIYLLGSLIKKNIVIEEVGYICETRMYGYSKTSSGIIQFIIKGVPYIMAALKRGK
tara:strand:- start:200 stop:994 length:795 start_codon:yes stop_codon:yes gene_type:complete